MSQTRLPFTVKDMDALYGTRPAVSTAQSITCPEGYEVYTLQTGDTLQSVAADRGITLTELLFYNSGLNPFNYKSGDTLCVPEKKSEATQNTTDTGNSTQSTCTCPQVSSDTPAVQPETTTCDASYTVVSGDTLRIIAQKNEVTLETLLAANPSLTSTRLQVGQTLCIPKKAVACPENYTSIAVESTEVADYLTTYDVSYNALADANSGIDLTQLQKGQTLCVPPKGTRGNCASGKAAAVVGEGTTLTALAEQLKTTVSSLLKANGHLLPSDFVKGQVFCLPE